MLELLLHRRRELLALYRKSPDLDFVIRLREVNLLIKRLNRHKNSGPLPKVASIKDVKKELQLLAKSMESFEGVSK